MKKSIEEIQVTNIVRRVLTTLETLAVLKGFKTPTIYSVVLFREPREIKAAGLIRVSEDVLVSEEGAIVVKHTNILPLLVERVAVGYYALCSLKSRGLFTADEARRLAVADLLLILSSLSATG